MRSRFAPRLIARGDSNPQSVMSVHDYFLLRLGNADVLHETTVAARGRRIAIFSPGGLSDVDQIPAICALLRGKEIRSDIPRKRE